MESMLFRGQQLIWIQTLAKEHKISLKRVRRWYNQGLKNGAVKLATEKRGKYVYTTREQFRLFIRQYNDLG